MNLFEFMDKHIVFSFIMFVPSTFTFCEIIAIFLRVFSNTLNRIQRHWNIRKLGYPPAHCDADGDFKE